MSYPTCSFLKDDGVPCGSPALRGKKLCYYHQRDYKRRQYAAKVLRQLDPLNPHAPLPKALPDIQTALHRVLAALVENRIDHTRAGILLFAPQQAAKPLCQPPTTSE